MSEGEDDVADAGKPREAESDRQEDEQADHGRSLRMEDCEAWGKCAP